jgi:hypothetical protein
MMEGERAQNDVEAALRIRQGADIAPFEPDLVEAGCMVPSICENGVVDVNGDDVSPLPKPPQCAGYRNSMVARTGREVEQMQRGPGRGVHDHRHQRPSNGSEPAEVPIDDPEIAQFAAQKHRVRIRPIDHFGRALVKPPGRNPQPPADRQ